MRKVCKRRSSERPSELQEKIFITFPPPRQISLSKGSLSNILGRAQLNWVRLSFEKVELGSYDKKK